MLKQIKNFLFIDNTWVLTLLLSFSFSLGLWAVTPSGWLSFIYLWAIIGPAFSYILGAISHEEFSKLGKMSSFTPINLMLSVKSHLVVGLYAFVFEYVSMTLFIGACVILSFGVLQALYLQYRYEVDPDPFYMSQGEESWNN